VHSPHITRLTLTNFRNYAALALDFRPGAVVLTGDNGAGKTNLLEAVSLLAPGRGLRRAAYGEVAREGGDGGFALHARLDGPNGEAEIGTGTSGNDVPGEGGRKVRINGAAARSAEAKLEWLRNAIQEGIDSGDGGSAEEVFEELLAEYRHPA